MRCSPSLLGIDRKGGALRPGSEWRRRFCSSRGLLDPQSAPAGRRDVAVDHLAPVRGDEEVAAVALVVVLRRGLIMDRSLRNLGLRLAARQRKKGRGAGGGRKEGAAADAGWVESLTHERLLRRRDLRSGLAGDGEPLRPFRMILNWRAVNRRGRRRKAASSR